MNSFVVQKSTNHREVEEGWPADYNFLKNIENNLKCTICKEFYTSPMSLACSHTFCSLCVRSYFSTQSIKKTCPFCHSDSDENDLRKEPCLESLVQEFKSGRDLLKRTLFMSKKQLSTSREDSFDIKTTITLDEDSTDVVLEKTNHFQKEKCPVCFSSNYLELDLNLHLDNCLSINDSEVELVSSSFGQSLKRATSPSHLLKQSDSKKQKYLPKVLYSIMKDKQLKRILKDLNLSTIGDKSTLQKRHAQYVKLYNSNCDSARPKSEIALQRELSLWEKTNLNPKPQGTIGILTQSKSQVTIKDDDFNESHSSKYQSEFKALIEKARSTYKKK